MLESKIIHKNSRAFNSVYVDLEKREVRKSSSDFKKLKAEALWYNSLPPSLMKFLPEFKELNQENSELILEYCPYPSLAEVFTQNPKMSWDIILMNLKRVHSEFREFHREVTDEVLLFHQSKTQERIDQIQNSDLSFLLAQKTFVINEKEYRNIDYSKILEDLETYSKLYGSSGPIHGDYCLSNILSSSCGRVIKLVDPRGYLLDKNTPTIIGDIHYDMAKLLHSIHGYYDFIVQGKYELIHIKDNNYLFTIDAPKEYSDLYLFILSRSGSYFYQLLLEILLFVTMIPLHYEDRNRQIAFYLRAIQLYSSLYYNMN